LPVSNPHQPPAIMLLTAIAVFTSLSFIAYGAGCLSSGWMRAEFERYGLARWRVITGFLEILGAGGVLLGLTVPLVGLLAAGGLTILMVGAFGVRLRIRDSFLQTLPSFLYLILTLYLAFLFYHLL
jgi:hypothetical protein